MSEIKSLAIYAALVPAMACVLVIAVVVATAYAIADEL